MSDYARITPTGGVLIDTFAWIAARTGGILTDLTDRLHGWARHHRDQTANPGVASDWLDAGGPGRGWPGLANAWCEHTGHRVGEPGLVVHQGTRLDTSVWILPATANDVGHGGPGAGRIAVIRTGNHPPLVYVDTTTDPWVWRDADTVTITCPTPGHWWVWRSGRELLTSTSRPATLTGVFGMNLDAPFSPCADCAAFQLGQRAAPCGCDGAPWIVCPVCGRRCRLGPPHP